MLNTIIKVNEEGLHVAYCANCGNQLNYLEFGGYEYCQSKGFDCKSCDRPCSGLKEEHEEGFYERIVFGLCKKCNTTIVYY